MPAADRWQDLDAEQLLSEWSRGFESTEAAIAHAIWVANRLAKLEPREERREFYSLKDDWLRLHSEDLVSGHVTRHEVDDCWGCGGSGYCNCDDGWWHGRECNRCYGTGECERCDGTGIYWERTLYEHRLVVAGQRYSFHSYSQPRLLSDEPGADLSHYGGTFTEEEITALPLPFQGLLRMLRYVKEHLWMRRNSESCTSHSSDNSTSRSMGDSQMASEILYTIGYGRWSTGVRIERLVSALKAAEVTMLVDVRHAPCSSGLPPKGSTNYWPKPWHLQPGNAGIAATLAAEGITYRWLVELGNPQKTDEKMTALREHIASGERNWPVNRGLDLLEDMVAADGAVICLLCACAKHEDCHRKLIAEEFVNRSDQFSRIVDLSS